MPCCLQALMTIAYSARWFRQVGDLSLRGAGTLPASNITACEWGNSRNQDLLSRLIDQHQTSEAEKFSG